MAAGVVLYARGAPLVEDGTAGHVDLSRLRAVGREVIPNSPGPALRPIVAATILRQGTGDLEAGTQEAETVETAPILGHDLQVIAARHPVLGQAQAHDRDQVQDELFSGHLTKLVKLSRVEAGTIPILTYFVVRTRIYQADKS